MLGILLLVGVALAAPAPDAKRLVWDGTSDFPIVATKKQLMPIDWNQVIATKRAIDWSTLINPDIIDLPILVTKKEAEKKRQIDWTSIIDLPILVTKKEAEKKREIDWSTLIGTALPVMVTKKGAEKKRLVSLVGDILGTGSSSLDWIATKKRYDWTSLVSDAIAAAVTKKDAEKKRLVADLFGTTSSGTDWGSLIDVVATKRFDWSTLIAPAITIAATKREAEEDKRLIWDGTSDIPLIATKRQFLPIDWTQIIATKKRAIDWSTLINPDIIMVTKKAAEKKRLVADILGTTSSGTSWLDLIATK